MASVVGRNATGGFIGRANNNDMSIIKFCSFTGDITGNNQVGGFIGLFKSQGSITSCYSTGSISGNTYVGGFIGDGSNIFSSYSTSAVTGINTTGGFVGLVGMEKLINNYSTGAVSSNSNGGGFSGNFNVSNDPENCFWDTDSSNQASSPIGTGKTNIEMNQENSFTNFDFVNTWGIDEGVMDTNSFMGSCKNTNYI
jgi:hypothetical protein